MSRVYWDSMMFIYWIEGHPQYSERVSQILERMEAREDELCTSTFTLGEVLTGAYKRQDTASAERMRTVFRDPDVQTVPFTEATADRYAQIRSKFAIPAADAIHLATASQMNADVFITNDRRLTGKVIPGIQFIVSIDTELF